MSDTEDDAVLYERAIAGERPAVEAIVRRHHANLVRYARSKTNSDALADDAVGEAWMLFFRHIERARNDADVTLRSPGRLLFWLLRTSANALYSAASAEERERDRASRAGADALGRRFSDFEFDGDVVDRMEQREQMNALREAFRHLGQRCRELLGLLMSEPPLSYQDIADLLDRPIGWVGPTRQRCLAELRKTMSSA